MGVQGPYRPRLRTIGVNYRMNADNIKSSEKHERMKEAVGEEGRDGKEGRKTDRQTGSKRKDGSEK